MPRFLEPLFGWLTERSWFGDSTLDWLLALAVTFAVTVSLGWLNRFLHARLVARGHASDASLNALLVDATGRTRLFFRLAAGCWAGLVLIELPESVEQSVSNTLTVMVAVQLGLWVSGLVRHMVEVLLERHAPDEDIAHRTGRNILRTTGTSIVWISVFLLCLHNVGINVTALVTTLGVVGFAVSMSVQKIGSDVLASACILMDRPFLVGDFLIVDGIRGTVERIGIRTTQMRSLDGEQLIFTNSDLANARILNYKTMTERRMAFEFAVRHDTPHSKMSRLSSAIGRLIDEHPRARFDRAHWHGFGTHAFLIEVVFYAQDQSLNVAYDVQQDIFLSLLEWLEKERIELAVGTAMRISQDPALAPRDSGPAQSLGFARS